jgi:hypothetical protein
MNRNILILGLSLGAAMLFGCADTPGNSERIGEVSQAITTVDFDNAPQGAHFAQGSSAPVCTLSGLTVSCTGTQIAGVGNTNATVTLSVTSTFTGVCHNPGVNSKVVEPFTESETTTTSSVITSTKNGRLVVPPQTATGTSSAEFLADFTCPNPRWTPEVTGTSISFTYSLTFAGFGDPAILITGP